MGVRSVGWFGMYLGVFSAIAARSGQKWSKLQDVSTHPYAAGRYWFHSRLRPETITHSSSEQLIKFKNTNSVLVSLHNDSSHEARIHPLEWSIFSKNMLLSGGLDVLSFPPNCCISFLIMFFPKKMFSTSFLTSASNLPILPLHHTANTSSICDHHHITANTPHNNQLHH